MNKFILHTLGYYLCWFTCIFLASKNIAWLGFFLCFFVTAVQFYWQKKIEKTESLLLFMVIVTFIGLLMDTCFLRGGLIYFNANPFGLKLSPPWMIALWLNFSIILYVFFKKYFSKFWLCFIVCCCGFPAAYLSGVKLGAARLMHANFSILFITCAWSLVLPATLFFYKKYILGFEKLAK
ncbi:MAG: DUF2878 domain-containing protein [Gammaproteobacteria bacterium]|nr:DUF2878 domain-containing protein [Gammaproteobacteria bacterium]